MPTGDSDTSSLHTVTDSLQQQLYRYNGDRRMQALNEDYMWPCDKTATSLELKIARLFELTYANGLHYEPEPGQMREAMGVVSLDGPARILDLGSGLTASWAIAMAEHHPRAEVIGIDLIPTELSYLPANLSIEIHDLFEGLPYPDDYFNLIHCRFGGTSATFFDNPDVDFLAEVVRALKPGGVLLLEEVYNMLSPFHSPDPSNPALPLIQARHWLRFSLNPPGPPASQARNDWGQRMGKLVRATEGFDSVLDAHVDLPLGTLPDEGPPERQRGSIVREGVLDAWELQAAAQGTDDETLAALREADEEAIPVEHAGVSVRIAIVWATKAGGSAASTTSSGQQ